MTVSDWWIVGATIVAGIMAALATWFAVVYTNKRTAENYKRDIERQHKEDAMAIVKPKIKSGTFGGIIEELILYNIRDRVLLLSSERDGFDFFDDSDRLWVENHRIFSIRNESKNNIRLVNIETYSKLITDSNAIIEDNVSNFIKLLRSNEEILFRICNTEQRNKLWEQLYNRKQVTILFRCKIDYLTFAGEQICYEYEAQITNTPVAKTIEGKEHITNDSKTSVIKDEYSILDKITLDESKSAAIFRNLQDNAENIDRIKYAHNKVGAAQAQGLMSEFGYLFRGVPEQTNSNTGEATQNEIKI